ncbi:MAG: hypothetical protein M3N47_08760, partial [Chloroflexota bacterium]|nr:hypothetical protein [Chloroflexota bacterium]
MAYAPNTKGTGVDWVHAQLEEATTDDSIDGLQVVYSVTPDGDLSVEIPERLSEFLLGLRLLRGLPLSYLVPDIALLPPESIRFFHVDRGWIDRVIDGVFSLANPGNLDLAFDPMMLKLIRDRLDDDMAAIVERSGTTVSWDQQDGPVTGMLIRSELARRWPDMIVEAYAGVDGNLSKMALLRSEPLSRDLYIALFAGQPARVEIREPFAGVRFGVEGTAKPWGCRVDRRDFAGEVVSDDDVAVPPRDESARVIDVAGLAANIGLFESRMVALHLEQRPYVQVFVDDEAVPESRG